MPNSSKKFGFFHACPVAAVQPRVRLGVQVGSREAIGGRVAEDLVVVEAHGSGQEDALEQAEPIFARDGVVGDVAVDVAEPTRLEGLVLALAQQRHRMRSASDRGRVEEDVGLVVVAMPLAEDAAAGEVIEAEKSWHQCRRRRRCAPTRRPSTRASPAPGHRPARPPWCRTNRAAAESRGRSRSSHRRSARQG